ncbi:MAG: hypothetical protein KC503_07175 [Myxococcales bacterium]|nr:hypothetical protein [Myxococcales bacterium]
MSVIRPQAAPAAAAQRKPSGWLEVIRGELGFALVLGAAFLVAALGYGTPTIAAWLGFAFAGYSVVANDSIQTIGTFLSANMRMPWWALWLFVAGIFLVTTLYGWLTYGGDVSYGRLMAKGFATAPTSFSYLQITAPLFLLVLTRLRMPVSTTFLILSCFASTSGSVWGVLIKSVSGYGVAFAVAIVMWLALAPLTRRLMARGEAHPAWRVGQWATSGILWAVWLMQDAANVAVFLPRSLSIWELVLYGSLLSAGLVLLIKRRGGRIQGVITEKSDVLDTRPATFVNLVYAAILYVFKVVSRMPMSTTWVFIGLLGGREIVINAALPAHQRRSRGELLWIITKDVILAGIGLLVSLALAVVINPVVRTALFGS